MHILPTTTAQPKSRVVKASEDAEAFLLSLINYTDRKQSTFVRHYKESILFSATSDKAQSQLSSLLVAYSLHNIETLYGCKNRATVIFDETEILCSALTNCSTIEHAIHTAIRFDLSKAYEQRDRTASLSKSTHNATFTFDVHRVDQTTMPRLIALGLLGVLFYCNLFRWLANQKIAYEHVLLPDTYKNHLENHPIKRQLEELIGCNIHFANSSASIVFRREDLALAVIRNHEELLEVIRTSHIALLEVQSEQPYTDRVGKAIIKLLLSAGNTPTLDAVSRVLNKSNSTIRRHLDYEGTSFQKLLDQCRFKIADEQLLQTELNVNDIAFNIGFKSLASFSYAFKKWSGASPQAYRKHYSGHAAMKKQLKPPSRIRQ